PVPAGPLRQAPVGQLAHVAPVVVGEDHRDVVGDAQPAVPVPLDLLVERPDLRGGGRVLAGDLAEDLALLGDDAAHQLDAVAVRQADVAVPAHADGHDALEVLVDHPLDAVPPVLLDGVAVAAVAPLARAPVRVVAGFDDVAVLVPLRRDGVPV